MTQTMVDELEAALTEPTAGPLREIFKEMIPVIQQRLEQGDAHWARIQALYQERRRIHESEKAQALRLLKELGHEAPKSPARRKEDPKPGPEAIEKTVRWLAGQKEPKSFKDIAESLDIALSSATKQVAVAKKLDLVRIAKRGGTTGRMQFFAVHDDAIQRLDEGRVQWQ